MKKTITICGLFASGVLSSRAQTAITSANISTAATANGNNYTAAKAPEAGSNLTHAGNYTYSYGKTSGLTDNAKTLKAFTAGGSGYTYNSGVPVTIKIRRVENPVMTAYRAANNISGSVPVPTPRDLAYYEGLADNSAATIKIKSEYIPKMENLFLSNDVAIGIDNMFANTTGTNFNNIERVDVIATAGITVQQPAAQGFAVFERGDYDKHDPTVVALITSLDINGDPLTYASKVVRVATTDYYITGQTTNTVYQPSNTAAGNFIILRRDQSSETMKVSDLIGAGQGIGGVLIRYSDFGLAAGTTVYGYSVLANDFPVTGTGTNVRDYTNATYFPLNSDGGTTAAGNDMATITGVVKIMKISGNVYNDANGMTDDLINGNAINKADNSPLYVNLVNAANIVVGVAEVQADGSFTFDQLEFGPLTAQLSTNKGTVGSARPQVALPGNWVNTGEAYGVSNASGSGNEAAGMANGIVNVQITDIDITAIKFGIEQRPVSDPKAYTNVANAAFSSTPPAGFPNINNAGNVYYTIATSSAALTGYSGNGGKLTGSDAEDCSGAGSCNTGRSFKIGTINANTKIYYDFGVSGGGIKQVLANDIITNYNPAALIIYGLKGNAATAKPLGFTYALVDAAGIAGVPVSYSITTPSPLPLDLIRFEVSRNEDKATISWTTANEQNIAFFDVLNSKDANNWQRIATVAAEGGVQQHHYLATDENLAAGNNYYKLKSYDHSGEWTESRICILSGNKVAANIKLYPNPAKELVTVSGLTGDECIQVADLNGRVILTRQATASQELLYVKDLLPGLYQVVITNNSTLEKSSYKIQLFR